MGTRYPFVIEHGTLRAFLPVELRYPLAGEVALGRGMGMVDTGGTTMMPEKGLPPGVTFDDLEPGGTMRMLGGERAYRYWPVEVTIHGLPIALRVKVYQGAHPDFLCLGLEDLARVFRFTFDGGGPDPYIEIVPHERLQSVAFAGIKLLEYRTAVYASSGNGIYPEMTTRALPNGEPVANRHTRRARAKVRSPQNVPVAVTARLVERRSSVAARRTEKLSESSPTIRRHAASQLTPHEVGVTFESEPTDFDRDPAPDESAANVLPAVEPYVLIFKGDALVPDEGHPFNRGH